MGDIVCMRLGSKSRARFLKSGSISEQSPGHGSWTMFEVSRFKCPQPRSLAIFEQSRSSPLLAVSPLKTSLIGHMALAKRTPEQAGVSAVSGH